MQGMAGQGRARLRPQTCGLSDHHTRLPLGCQVTEARMHFQGQQVSSLLISGVSMLGYTGGTPPWLLLES